MTAKIMTRFQRFPSPPREGGSLENLVQSPVQPGPAASQSLKSLAPASR